MPSILWLLCILVIGNVHCDEEHHKRTNMLPNRTVIVQMFEWKWLDIADECERFLGPKGYGAVQTSPVSENLIIHLDDGSRPWYERYQVMSYKLQTRSGSEADFLSMTTRCNNAGVRIYIDVVFNHMTGNHPTNKGTAGSTGDFRNFDYPAVPYRKEHFNQPECELINFYNATEVRDCQLVGLKDLNQTIPYVREKILEHLNELVSLGVAGFRVDAAKHMWPEDLRAIYNSVDDLNTAFGFLPHSRPYYYQEVSQGGGGTVTPPEYTDLGDVTEFTLWLNMGTLLGYYLKEFDLYCEICLFDYTTEKNSKNASRWAKKGVSTLYEIFYAQQKPLNSLIEWGSPAWSMVPSANALIFVENHDTQRASNALNYKFGSSYMAAIAFLLAHPYGQARITSGYFFDTDEQGPPYDSDENIKSPIIYEDGTCGGGWVCEHRRSAISRMAGFRNKVFGTKVTNWWDNGYNQIAFSRGSKGFIAINIEGQEMNRSLQTGLPAGTYCDIRSGESNGNTCTGKTVTVSEQGVAEVALSGTGDDLYVVIHIGEESRLQK